MEPIRHIYAHIPFCARLCPYCAFYKTLPDRALARRFCEALVAETAAPACPLQPETIFFGGGTPTALSRADLDYLLTGFRQALDPGQLAEWTFEANPGSVSRAKAELLRGHGVNRLSLGVQSWDDDLLRLLGREHNAAQADESFHEIRAAGFKNISIDLMFGLPGQTLAQWRASLERTVALGPEHISTYCLTYEEDTDFFLRHQRGELRQDPDADAGFFELAATLLGEAGYHHYEVSNHARPGFESAHNRAYWAGANYLGLGPSAFSTVGVAAVAKRARLPGVYRSGPGRGIGHFVGGTSLRGSEARRADRPFAAHVVGRPCGLARGRVCATGRVSVAWAAPAGGRPDHSDRARTTPGG